MSSKNSSDSENFTDIDNFVIKAREHFRSHALKKHEELSKTIDLFFSLVRSIYKFKPKQEWENSREESIINVLTDAVESILGFYYLSESGFYELSLSLKRNIVELMLVSIAIGYDSNCYIDWKNNRQSFRSAHAIAKRITNSSDVPDIDKKMVPDLVKYWEESSSLHSHKLLPESISAHLHQKGLKLDIKTIKEETQIMRMNTVRNMLLDVISIFLGIFDYGRVAEANKEKLPEALALIQLANEMFKPEISNQPTI